MSKIAYRQNRTQVEEETHRNNGSKVHNINVSGLKTSKGNSLAHAVTSVLEMI